MKKENKNLLALLLCVVAMLMPEVVLAKGADLKFSYNEGDKTAEVISDGEYYYDIVIPETVVKDGVTYRVTSIGERAFHWSRDLKSVKIPNSVTNIGKEAFYLCDKLTSVTMSNSVTNIGESAFYECKVLTSLTLPNTVTSIGRCAFDNCESLASINIPEKITTIEEYTFHECHKLASIIIPNKVTSIGSQAFDGCRELTSINIPNTVTSIGRRAFCGCSKLKSLIIPSSVTTLGGSIVGSCDMLESLTIPNSVINYDKNTDIFDYAKRSLKTVVMSFRDMADFTAYLQRTDISTLFYNKVLSEVKHEILIAGEKIKDIVIPNSLTTIPSNAFTNCSELTSVTIGTSVNTIGDNVFKACTGLQKITCLPFAIPSLGSDVFKDIDQSHVTLVVASTMDELYRAAEPWKNFNIAHFLRVLTTCDSELGECIGGGNVVNVGDKVTISAIPKAGVAFIGWSDGNKDNPRSFTVESNSAMIYTAMLRKGGYVVNVSTNDSIFGTATSQNVAYLEALPTDFGDFSQWSDGNTDNPRLIPLNTLTDDISIEAQFEPGMMTLYDGEPYAAKRTDTYKALNYLRAYSNNLWSAWFVPFAVDAATLKNNGFEAAYIEGIHRYDKNNDGVIDETVMEVIKIKNGRLRAGMPYIVKAGKTYSYPLSLSNVTLMSDTEMHDIETATATAEYNFKGTYSGMTAEEVIAADNYYSVNKSGELVHRQGEILPLRWFLQVISKGSVYDEYDEEQSKEQNIRIKVVGEEDVTGIRTIYPESEQKIEAFDGMFDLSGRKLSQPKHGVNIINGKKTLVK